MLGFRFNKVAGVEACKSIKRRLQHRYFPVNITNFKNSFFYRTSLVAASGIKLFFSVRDTYEFKNS